MGLSECSGARSDQTHPSRIALISYGLMLRAKLRFISNPILVGRSSLLISVC